jgi:hypothetical protein
MKIQIAKIFWFEIVVLIVTILLSMSKDISLLDFQAFQKLYHQQIGYLNLTQKHYGAFKDGFTKKTNTAITSFFIRTTEPATKTEADSSIEVCRKLGSDYSSGSIRLQTSDERKRKEMQPQSTIEIDGEAMNLDEADNTNCKGGRPFKNKKRAGRHKKTIEEYTVPDILGLKNPPPGLIAEHQAQPSFNIPSSTSSSIRSSDKATATSAGSNRYRKLKMRLIYQPSASWSFS